MASDAPGAAGRRSPRRADLPLPRIMMGATAGMAALTVALTVLAGPLYGLASRAAGDLLDPVRYVHSVLAPGEVR